jgi:hypothetical protein
MIGYEIAKLQTIILTAQTLLCKCYFSTRQYKASNVPFTNNKSVHTMPNLSSYTSSHTKIARLTRLDQHKLTCFQTYSNLYAVLTFF